MKICIGFRRVGALLGCSICLSSFAGEFINLGFDAPDTSSLQTELVPVYQGSSYQVQYGSVSRLLPGWQLKYDGVAVDKVYYGYAPSGVALTQPGADSPFGIYVRGGRVDANTGQEISFSISLSQQGLVPTDATELRFLSHWFMPPVQIRIDGTPVSAKYLDLPSKPYIFAADVSAFAGSNVNLEFDFPVWAGSEFDILGFYPIPEPSTFALFGLGGMGLGWWLRRKRGEA